MRVFKILLSFAKSVLDGNSSLTLLIHKKKIYDKERTTLQNFVHPFTVPLSVRSVKIWFSQYFQFLYVFIINVLLIVALSGKKLGFITKISLPCIDHNTKRNDKSDLAMYMKRKKTWDEFKALKRKKSRKKFQRSICCLFLLVVIVQLIVVITINGKKTDMIRGMYVVLKVFNIPRIHGHTVYADSKGNMTTLKTIFPIFDHTFQPIVLSRTTLSRQLPTSNISSAIATMLQTGKASSKSKQFRQVSTSTISTPVATVLQTGKVLSRTKKSRQLSTNTISIPVATVLQTGKVFSRTKKSRQVSTSTNSTPVANVLQTGKVLSRTKQSRQVSTSTIITPAATVLRTGKVLPRTKQLRQLPTNTISTPVATVLQTGKVLSRTMQSRQVSTSTILAPVATVLRTDNLLSRTKQSRQLPANTTSTPVATMSQTVTSEMHTVPNFEFFYQYCDWIQRNNLTTLNQMYTNCSKLCPPKPPCLVGLIYTTMDSLTLRELERKFSMLRLGGRYSPPDCIARHNVAIIISYRNRGLHLRILLNNLHPFLQKQQLDYGIFVIEQVEGSTFNRAMLMNIGFKEALSIYNYTCFIFHDVDHIPENDNNIYSCSGNPRHMAVAVDKFRYRMPYYTYFGGVSSLSRKEMEIVNGFSNKYFGWGGEDDDMWRRMRAKNLEVVRYSPNIGRYRTIRHKRDKGNERSGVRLAQIKKATSLMDKDGLNSLKYTRIKIINRKICTLILVKINQSEVLNT